MMELKVNDAIELALLKLRKTHWPIMIDYFAIISDIAKALQYFGEATEKVSGEYLM